VHQISYQKHPELSSYEEFAVSSVRDNPLQITEMETILDELVQTIVAYAPVVSVTGRSDKEEDKSNLVTSFAESWQMLITYFVHLLSTLPEVRVIFFVLMRLSFHF
jgi:hypothetical protein